MTNLFHRKGAELNLGILCVFLFIPSAFNLLGAISAEQDENLLRRDFNQFLSFFTIPSPPPINTQLFADDVTVFWFSGKSMIGSGEVVKATEQLRTLNSALFTSLTLTSENLTFHQKDNAAWLTSEVKIQGILKERNRPHKDTTRLTLIFEKRNNLWKITHLHGDKTTLPKTSESSVQGDIQHVHDPVIMKQGDTYYVYSTGQGIPLRRSKDFFYWEHIGSVFKEMPEWAKKEIPGARDIWAPDISFHNGVYRLYYAVSTFGSSRSCIGLATNKTLNPDDPNYRWVDEGKVLESHTGSNWNAIDPNFVTDEKGTCWLTFGSYWSGIKLVQLDCNTGKPATQPLQLISLACRPEETSIEAPFIVRKNGYYYLFVSFDQCCKGIDSNYKTYVGRASQITGPYVDRQGKPMMKGGGTLMLTGYSRWRGPGHNAVLFDDTGDWLVHHTYDIKTEGVPILQIRRMLWAADGWPLPGEPYEGKGFEKVQITAEQMVGTWDHSVDFVPASGLKLLVNGMIDNPETKATWSLEGSTLTLRWPRNDAPGDVWIDQCVVSPDGKWYVGRNQKDMIIRGKKIN